MVDYREILRLKHLKYTNTDISSSVHSSRNTVQEVLSIAEALNVKWPLDDDVTNIMLEAVLYPERRKKAEERLMPDYPRIHKELAKKGVTLSLLWTEYCMEAKNAGKKPYMSTQFNDNYHKWARVTKATMRIQHKPGDRLSLQQPGYLLHSVTIVSFLSKRLRPLFPKSSKSLTPVHFKNGQETAVQPLRMKKRNLCSRFPYARMNRQSGPLPRSRMIISYLTE